MLSGLIRKDSMVPNALRERGIVLRSSHFGYLQAAYSCSAWSVRCNMHDQAFKLIAEGMAEALHRIRPIRTGTYRIAQNGWQVGKKHNPKQMIG